MKYQDGVEAFTFDELVAYGLKHCTYEDSGMPWAFTFRGCAVTHENDNCYGVSTPQETLVMGRDDLLVFGVTGIVFLCKRDLFEDTYGRIVPKSTDVPETQKPKDPMKDAPDNLLLTIRKLAMRNNDLWFATRQLLVHPEYMHSVDVQNTKDGVSVLWRQVNHLIATLEEANARFNRLIWDSDQIIVPVEKEPEA